LRAYPAEAGLDPNFTVLDEGQAALQQRQVLAEALALAANTPALVPLFEHLGERSLADTLASLLTRRLDTRTCLSSLPDNLLMAWAPVLTARQKQSLARLLAGDTWLACMACLQENEAYSQSDRMDEQRRLALAALKDGMAGSLPERLSALGRLNDINLSGGSGKNWPGGRDQVDTVKEALRCLRELWSDQASLLTLTLTPADEQCAQVVPLLRDLFQFMDQRYCGLKQELDVLDFDDLEDQALTLLRQHESVCQRWRQEVRALLVDEFQDTNVRQRDLLDLLNGGEGKLFIVGDAKQSIYRFRGADVSVFRQERRRIEQNGGQTMILVTSYRAHQDLLEGLNDLMRPVLGTVGDPERPWLEPFARLAPHRVKPGAGFTAPHLELHLTVGSKTSGALDRAASALVGRLVELVESGQVEVGVGPKARPLNYGDVALLCRASTSFGPYEDALERAGVPYLTVAGRGFYERPEIRDLLNALQALADPSDDLALAGLLRSPALALSDAALYRLAQAIQASQAGSLWAALSQLGPALPEPDGSRAMQAIRIIQSLHDQAGRVTVADLLKQFLDETAYRAGLIQAGQRRAARNVAKLLADAQTSGLVGVGEFLEYISGLRATAAREGEARTPAEGVVQLMSVHAAKGLEFPVVILGDITHSQPSRNDLLLDSDLGLLLPQKDENREMAASYRLGKLRTDDQEAAEADRLLYVAATRAMEKLLVSGCVTLKRDGTLGGLTGWLKRLVGPEGVDLTERAIDYDENGAAVRELPLHVGVTPVICRFYEPGYQPVMPPRPAPAAEVEWPTPLPPPFLKPFITPVDQAEMPETDRPQQVWRVVPIVDQPRAPAWVVGQLVHTALAAWRFPDHTFADWVLAQARNYGLVDERQLDDAIRESQRLLRHFQASDLYRAMDRAEQRLHEVPFSLQLDGSLVSGIMDALFRENGTWTLIEFKTDRIRNETDLHNLLRDTDYLAQVQRYAQVIKQLLGQVPRAMLCWLNHRDGVLVQEVTIESLIRLSS
jgi:ATP-dependent helicase/nuclease subunit A